MTIDEYNQLKGNVEGKKKGAKPNKYNAKKTEFAGEVYDSAKEAAYAAQMHIQKKTTGPDKVLKIEKQVRYDIVLNDQKICFYKLDFKVTYANRIEYIDVKGLRRGCAYQMFKLKKKLVEAQYGIKITEV